MLPFTVGEVAINRADLADLPDRCTIARYARLDDGAGGYTEQWQPDAAPTACRVAAQLAPGERQQGAGIQLVMQFTVTLPIGTTLGARDRLLWADPLTTTRTLQVVGIGGRSRAYTFRVECIEVGV